MKETYLISYDLNEPNATQYDQVWDYIKSYPTWAHINQSLWAVVTDKSAKEIRNALVEQIGIPAPSLIVIKSGVESAWNNPLCSSIWLKKYL